MQLDPLLHLLLRLGPGLVVVVVALAAAPAVAEVAGRGVGGVATVLLYMRQGGVQSLSIIRQQWHSAFIAQSLLHNLYSTVYPVTAKFLSFQQQ